MGHPPVETPALSASRAPVRLLLIAEYPPLVKALRCLLEEEGYTVEVPGSDESPADRIAECDYDLIILDVKKPGAAARSAAEDWRQRCPRTPVLVLAPLPGPGALAPGVSAWLAKPFALDVLLDRLQVLLHGAPPAPATAPNAYYDFFTSSVLSDHIWKSHSVGLPK